MPRKPFCPPLLHLLCAPARRSALALGLTLLLGGQSAAETVPPQADLLFDLAGPAACELPPAGFGVEAFRTIAQSTDPARARGELSGAITANLVGLATYGKSPEGGLAVGYQGGYVTDDNRVAMLCVLLVRLGTREQPLGQANVLGESSLGNAADTAFLGVFKIVARDSAGNVESLATGEVKQGSLTLGRPAQTLLTAAKAPPGEYLSGRLAFDGILRTPGAPAPGDVFRLEARLPIAIDAMRRVPRLKRSP